MMKSNNVNIFFAFVAVTTLVSCGLESAMMEELQEKIKDAARKPVSVTLNKTTLDLAVGDEEQLTAGVEPENAADKSVSWSSDNTSIATVTSNGMVKAITLGTAIITVTTTDGGKTATCAVTVAAQSGITFSVEQITEGAPILDSITISRTSTGYPAASPVSVNASDYDTGSINWEVTGVGVYAGQTITGSNATFTLSATDIRYNSLGGHSLTLTVSKNGLQYQKAIFFTIVP